MIKINEAVCGVAFDEIFLGENLKSDASMCASVATHNSASTTICSARMASSLSQTEANKGKLKKRKRTVLSCIPCHARKQKCDRGRPCTNCVTRGVDHDCQYMSPVKKPHSDQSSSPEADQSSFDVEQFIYDSLRSLPNQDSSDLIVSHYFDHFTYLYPDMDFMEFRAQYCRFWKVYGLNYVPGLAQREHFDDIVWFSVFAAVINVTLQLAPRKLRIRIYHPSLTIPEMANKALDISTKARDSAPARKSSNVIWKLWSLILAASSQKNAGRAYIAQEVAQEAIGLAIRNNFHLNARTDAPLSQAQLEKLDQREQLWGMLYMMDRNLSFLLNKPPATKNLTLTTPQPRNVLVSGGEELPVEIMTKFSYYRVGERFCRIMDIIDETLQACKTLSNPRQKEILMSSIDGELEHFEANLPYAFSEAAVGQVITDESTKHIASMVPFARQMTLVYYLETVMRLHRPALAASKSTTPSANCLKSIDTALRLLRIQQEYISKVLQEDDEHALAWFVHSFFLYDPAMTLLLALLMFPAYKDTPIWCHAVDDADKLLFAMSELNVTANTGRNVLRVFKQQAARKLFICGKGWQGNTALVSVLDVDDINDAMNDTSVKNEQAVPFDYLGITVNWGLNREGTEEDELIADENLLEDLSKHNSETSTDTQVSPYQDTLDFDNTVNQFDFLNDVDFDFNMPLNPLDLLQTPDYMTLN